MANKKLPPEVLDYFRKQGAKGGKLGGAIAACNMTAEQRAERAKKAAEASAKVRKRNAVAKKTALKQAKAK